MSHDDDLFDALSRSVDLAQRGRLPGAQIPRKPTAVRDDPTHDPNRCAACGKNPTARASGAVLFNPEAARRASLGKCPACEAVVCVECLNRCVVPSHTPGTMRWKEVSCLLCAPQDAPTGYSKNELSFAKAQGLRLAPLRVEVRE